MESLGNEVKMMRARLLAGMQTVQRCLNCNRDLCEACYGCQCWPCDCPEPMEIRTE